jgi:hypothetical protein
VGATDRLLLTTATNSAGALLLRDTTTTIIVDLDLLLCAMAIAAGEAAFLLPIIAKEEDPLLPVVGSAIEATRMLCLLIRERPAGEVVQGVLLLISHPETDANGIILLLLIFTVTIAILAI